MWPGVLMLYLCAAVAGGAFCHFRGVNLHATISAPALRCTADRGGFFVLFWGQHHWD